MKSPHSLTSSTCFSLRLLCVLCVSAVCFSADLPKIVYTKSFPRSKPEYVEIALDKTGQGSYKEAPDDDSPLDLTSEILLSNVQPGYYLLIVGGFSSASGSYALHVNGTLAAGAACKPAQTYLACPSPTSCQDTGTGFKCQ